MKSGCKHFKNKAGLFPALLVLLFCGQSAYSETQTEDGKDQSNVHTVVDGDTLWDLASAYLKDSWRWPEIWNRNKASISNPDLIYPGQKILLSETPFAATEVPPSKTEETPEPAPPQEQPVTEPPAALAVKEDLTQNFARIGDILEGTKLQKTIRPKGKITGSETDPDKILLEAGNEVSIKFRRPASFPIGSIFAVMRRQELLLDHEGNFSEGEYGSSAWETVGAVQLTQPLGNKEALAKVLYASGPLEAGDALQLLKKKE